ncbi:hypothetical protein K458DRAFT_391489 [Lentithecium fluviatile CBS 122367]|uniref:Uncharacterized protein n=1 Tax=Lentithecium fluviatile CBS 122367 TaxID=1168545 RepID=A0A6G1IV41_9PLEO|nr:hypothetical protein K458DRAFT_391489 [Lentithecium fluviatile CBS 122367]
MDIDSYRPAASGWERWQPTIYAHDLVDKGCLERPDSAQESQSEEPRIPAKRAASADQEADSPPKRNESTKAERSSDPGKRRSARLIERKIAEDPSSVDTQMENAEDVLDGGVRIEGECLTTPEPVVEAISPDVSSGYTGQPQTEKRKFKFAWGAKQRALFSGSLRALQPNERKPSSPPPLPPPPQQKPENYRFTSGEHAGKALSEVPFGYLVHVKESGDWKAHTGFKEAFRYWQERMGANQPKSRPQDPALNHPRNWRIPDSAHAFTD